MAELLVVRSKIKDVVKDCNVAGDFAEALSEKVEQLIKDPELYAKLAKNAHAFVHENFSWPKYAKGVLDIMELALRKYE